MKSLQDYIQEKQTKLFEECNVIFAFSQKQFEEKKKEGITYVRMPYGMICDKTKTGILLEGLERIHKEGIQQDIKENGIRNIILRELANHECYYTNDWTDAADALVNYGITEEQVKKDLQEPERRNLN